MNWDDLHNDDSIVKRTKNYQNEGVVIKNFGIKTKSKFSELQTLA